MKENSIKNEQSSIEEDIKNAEHFIKSIKTDKEYKEENGWHGYYNKEIVELARILQHILSDYKRVLKINEVLLKENEELKNQKATARKINELLVQRYSNSISVQKVKDKIEELIKEGRHYNANKIEVLQELLESEE